MHTHTETCILSSSSSVPSHAATVIYARSFTAAGSLKGVPADLQLMVFLDSTKNAVAIKEAYNRNIPTIAMVNTTKDMSQVCGTTHSAASSSLRCLYDCHTP